MTEVLTLPAVNPWPKLDGNALSAAFPGVAIEIAGVASEAFDVWDYNTED